MSFSAPQRAGGFTLLEMLVVVAIIAFASVGVSFALRDSSQAQLEREAQRLAVLLEAARAQSRASYTPVRWRSTENGFVFDGLAPVVTEWLYASTRVQLASTGSAPVLVLGPEPLIGPQVVVLMQGERVRRVASDGLRPFKLSP